MYNHGKKLVFAFPIMNSRRNLHITQCACSFFEEDKKGGYNPNIKEVNIPVTAKISQGIDTLKSESIKFCSEVKQNFATDPILYSDHEDYEIIYRFNEEAAIEDWVVTCDSDHLEGKSHAEFVLGPNKRGIFRGILNTEVPKDGVIKAAGYANIRSPLSQKSFFRSQPFDWENYTHLIMMVRGDGRAYNVCLGMDRFYDIQWNDLYTFPLYTRGGPYWQYAKIPFSKFILSAKGRVQDKQYKIELNQVSSVGISLRDGYSGPFELEIEWIGVLHDENYKQYFDYELYKVKLGEAE